jgi:hypothetical protein
MPRVYDQPSRATVNFVLTNTSGEDRYVATSGRYCNALAIGNLTLSTQPWEEQCEGPMPIVTVTFTRIPAGGSLTVPWDARQAIGYETNVDCSLWGEPCQPTQMASLQAVAPGDYVVTFGIATLPDGGARCFTAATDQLECDTTSEGEPGFISACPANALGGTASSIVQSFAVPASGIATVPVTVP